MLSLLLASCISCAVPVFAPDEEVMIENGRAALASGAVRKGKFVVERDKSGEVTIRSIDKNRKRKVKGVVVLVDGEGVVAHPVPPTLETVPGFVALANDEKPDALADALHHFATKITDRANPARAALLAEALKLDPEHVATLRTLDELTVAERLPIYRELLEADPKNFEVQEAVERCLPEDLPLYGRIDTLGWVEFLELAARLKITVLADPDDPAPEFRAEKRKLGQAINTRIWEEEDLAGYRSEHLYVITSLHEPRLLSGLFQRGAAVIGALEEIFAEVEAKRSPRYPLPIYLYASREEFEEKGKRLRDPGNDAPHNKLGGHYSAADATTCLYFPDGEDAIARVQEVLAHELTHHWMHHGCPGLDGTEAGSVNSPVSVDRPGRWVEEGFALLVQELRFRKSGGFIAGANPLSPRLDVIAGANHSVLLRWEFVFGATDTKIGRLESFAGIKVPSRIDPTHLHQVTERDFFLAQATAACSYLFHHDADSRRRLLDYLLAFYRGDEAQLDLRRTLGLDAAAMGKEARLLAAEVCVRQREK